MKKVIALTVFLLLVSFAILDQSTPAQAAWGGSKYTSLVVQNSSSAPVYIRFQGPVTRDFMLQVGKNVVPLPAGRYTFQYTACGINFSDKINLSTNKAMRILPRKTTKIIINNYTLTEAPGTGLTLRLNGPVDYYFTITQPLEKFTVQQGAYEFTLRGCGKLIQSGSIKFDTAQYRWTIHCPR